MITREQIKKAINIINLGSDSFKEETRILGNAILGQEEIVLQLQDKLARRNCQIRELKKKIDAYKVMLQFSKTDYNEKTEQAKMNNLDRETGKLQNCFSPRYSK